MGELTRISFERISYLQEMLGGEVALRDRILGFAAEGRSLADIAAGDGLTYGALWRWMKATPGMMEAYQEMQEADAERKVYEALKIADMADKDTVGEAKLQIDTRFRAVKAWNRKRYGDNADVGVAGFGVGGITIVIGDVVRDVVRPVEAVVISDGE